MIELLERVKGYELTKDNWRNDSSTIEWKEANELNYFLYGKTLNKAVKCECIEDLFFMIKSGNIVKQINIKMKKRFFLKAGKVVMSRHGNLTEQSTDKQMIKVLSLLPKLITFFDRYPEDWKTICKNFDESSDEFENVPELPKEKKVAFTFVESTNTENVDEDITDVEGVEESEDSVSLSDLKVSKLIEIAEELKIEVPARIKKDDLIELILEAQK